MSASRFRLVPVLLAATTAAALSTATSTARAEIVDDGASFSVDLGDAHVCFVTPVEKRNPKECFAVDFAMYSQGKAPDGVVRLAYGILRHPKDAQDRRFVGNLAAVKLALATETAPDQEAADRFARGLVDPETVKLEPGAKFLPPRAWVVEANDVSVVRATIDVEGLDADNPSAHREVLVAFGTRSAYSVSWTSRSADAALVKGYADAAAKTVTLGPDIRPRRKIPWPYVAAGAAVLAAAILFVKRRAGTPRKDRADVNADE